MPYISNTEEQRREMLDAIGVESFEDLLTAIPSETRLKELHLHSGLSEMDTLEHLKFLASMKIGRAHV